MEKPPKEIEVVPYQSDWVGIFKVEAQKIRDFLKEDVIEIHHIGSTSVPGMVSKRDIDVLLIVNQLSNALKLSDYAYTFKGELNIPLRYFFSKNTEFSKLNLHVCEPHHGFTSLNLTFRDYLRTHPGAVKDYSNLKQSILKNPKASDRVHGFLSQYGSEKYPFIHSILKKAGFQDYIVNFCLHPREWEEYHRIKEQQLFRKSDVKYDRSHPSFKDENHYHLCLYKGTTIVGIAHVELLSEKKAALRSLAIDAPYQNHQHGSFFLMFIEKWLQQKKIEVIHVHAASEALNFYKKNGYIFMPFENDKSSFSATKEMGKVIL